MTQIITWASLVVNFYHALKRKKHRVIVFLMIIFMWILFWGNFDNPDYHNYSIMYYTTAQYTNSIEPGFVFLIYLGNLLHLNYHTFLSIIGIIGFLLIHSTIKEYTDNYHLVYALYFITPFFLDVIQVRNFLAMSIVIYSVRFLVENKKSHFFVFIIIATLFHRISLAYLPLIIINSLDKNKVYLKIVNVLSFLFALIILLNNKQIPLLNIILEWLNAESIYQYTVTETNWGFLIYWGIQFLSIFIMFYTKKIYNLLNSESENTTEKMFINTVYSISNLLIIYFPLYLLNSNFFRISRNVLILYYICFAILITKFKVFKNKIIYFLFIIIYTCIVAFFTIYMNGFHLPVLNNNFIF